MDNYFEQFIGDVKTYSMWNDERIAKILEEAGLSDVHWQSVSGIGATDEYRCDIITHHFTKDEIVTKLKSVQKRYGLMDINTFKPNWNEDETEAHAHFTVVLK